MRHHLRITIVSGNNSTEYVLDVASVSPTVRLQPPETHHITSTPHLKCVCFPDRQGVVSCCLVLSFFLTPGDPQGTQAFGVGTQLKHDVIDAIVDISHALARGGRVSIQYR